MAQIKEIVKISDIVKFGNVLAQSIRASLRGVTKKLGGSGMVKLTKGQSRNGLASISIVIGEGKKDPNSPTQPISGMIRAIEFGAKPHIISPRRGTRLAFMWDKATPPFKRGRKMAGQLPDGRLSFFFVEHPGMKGRHPIATSIRRTRGKATQELAKSIRMNIQDMLSITIREINRKVG